MPLTQSSAARRRNRAKVHLVCDLVALPFAAVVAVGLVLLSAPTWVWVPAGLIVWSRASSALQREMASDPWVRRRL